MRFTCSMCLVLWGLAFSLNAQALEDGAGCLKFIKDESALKASALQLATSSQSYGSIGEVSNFLECLQQDPAQNLLIKHPLNLMRASQRVFALVKSEGAPVKKRSWNLLGSKYYLEWPFFTKPPKNAPSMTMWQLDRVINSFTEYLRASAGDSKIGNKMFMMYGVSGTGKTQILDMLREKAKIASHDNPDFFINTFRWKREKLLEVPELKRMGIGSVADLIDPRGDSPFVLLTKDYQDKILEMSEENSHRLIGMEANPILREVNDFSKIVRDEIIKFERATHYKGQALTESQVMMDILPKYLDVIRLDWDEKFIRMSAEKGDVDYGLMIGKSDPVIGVTAGSQSPLAFVYGSVQKASGGVLVLDETLRFHENVRNKALDWIQSGLVTKDGHSVPIDALIIGASNYESLNKISARNEDVLAFVDRNHQVHVNFPTDPMTNMGLIFVMENLRKFEIKKLIHGQNEDGVESSWKQLDRDFLANELFKWKSTGQNGSIMMGPDGNYALRYKVGKDKTVFISPHALALMGLTITASRFITDPQAAGALGVPRMVVGKIEFTDEIARLRFLLGETFLEPDLEKELSILTQELNEGESGISNRTLQSWFQKSIQKAILRSEMDPTKKTQAILDPELIRGTFDASLSNKEIAVVSADERVIWKNLMTRIYDKIITPRIRHDVMAALGEETGATDQTYLEVYFEMKAVANGKSTYSLPDDPAEKMSRNVDKQRYDRILEIFRADNDRNFQIDELNQYPLGRYEEQNMGHAVQHPGLVKAIIQFNLERWSGSVTLSKMIGVAETSHGKEQDQTRYRDFLQIMEEQFGYDAATAREALLFVKGLNANNSNSLF